VGTAADNANRMATGLGNANRCTRTAVTQLSAMALAASVGPVLNRNVHDTKYGSVRFNERDVDCELTVAIDEFLGTVERVNQPVSLPLAALFKRRQTLFLGDNRDVRRQLFESRDDTPVRGEVRLCQRRLVDFALNVEIGGVDFEDRPASNDGEGNDRFNQFLEVHGDFRTCKQGAQYKAVTFDPKTAIDRCETLMLDMDGTILDLAFDNYVWKQLVPERYAIHNGLAYETARDRLFAKYAAIQGDLEWYCLDHWSERLGFDVLQLHHDVHQRIDYLPGARAFLERVRDMDIKVLLVTNSHPDTLTLKEETTGFSGFFDGIYSAHTLGFAKERQEFWKILQEKEGFEPKSTVFVDDTEPVLRSADAYGIDMLVTITRPDTSEPMRGSPEFAAVEGVAELLTDGGGPGVVHRK